MAAKGALGAVLGREALRWARDGGAQSGWELPLEVPPTTHSQLFLPHRLTRSGGGRRVCPPISDVSNPDSVPARQLPAAEKQAERAPSDPAVLQPR